MSEPVGNESNDKNQKEIATLYHVGETAAFHAIGYIHDELGINPATPLTPEKTLAALDCIVATIVALKAGLRATLKDQPKVYEGMVRKIDMLAEQVDKIYASQQPKPSNIITPD